MKKFFLPGNNSSKKSGTRGSTTDDHGTVEAEGSVSSPNMMKKASSGGSGTSSEFKSKAPDHQASKASMESPQYHEQAPDQTVTEEAPSDHIVEQIPTNYEHNPYIAPHAMEDNMGSIIFQQAVTDWINFPWDHQDNVGSDHDHDHGSTSRGFGYN